jgi:hypothetical protein
MGLYIVCYLHNELDDCYLFQILVDTGLVSLG